MCGTDVNTYVRERPGMSAFALEDGVVYHTYSTYARVLDGLWGMYQWLDRAPKGRNETGAGVCWPATTNTTTRSSRRRTGARAFAPHRTALASGRRARALRAETGRPLRHDRPRSRHPPTRPMRLRARGTSPSVQRARRPRVRAPRPGRTPSAAPAPSHRCNASELA